MSVNTEPSTSSTSFSGYFFLVGLTWIAVISPSGDVFAASSGYDGGGGKVPVILPLRQLQELGQRFSAYTYSPVCVQSLLCGCSLFLSQQDRDCVGVAGDGSVPAVQSSSPGSTGEGV